MTRRDILIKKAADKAVRELAKELAITLSVDTPEFVRALNKAMDDYCEKYIATLS